MRVVIFSLILGLVGPNNALAWGSVSHKIIAEIAEQYLEPETAKQVRDLLGIAERDNPCRSGELGGRDQAAASGDGTTRIASTPHSSCLRMRQISPPPPSSCCRRCRAGRPRRKTGTPCRGRRRPAPGSRGRRRARTAFGCRQLHVCRFDHQRQPLERDRLVAPGRLVSLARGEAHRHEGLCRNSRPFIAPVFTNRRTLSCVPS